MLELPYQGNNVSMIILLPKDKNTSSLEKLLSIERLGEWRKTLNELEVVDHIPKFKFSTEYPMANILEDIGMKSAFTPEADFSGISSSKPLFIFDIIHKAFVDLNEKETEAAASTGIVYGSALAIFGSPPPTA